MRYIELLGLVDDTFAKYRKEECIPDSEWKPYSFYNSLSDVKEGYSVYCGAVKEELNSLIERYQKENEINFTDEDLKSLNAVFETANNQNNDNDEWTDIMFRSKFYYIETLNDILTHYDISKFH